MVLSSEYQRLFHVDEAADGGAVYTSTSPYTFMTWY
jgi:hypothetical protein